MPESGILIPSQQAARAILGNINLDSTSSKGRLEQVCACACECVCACYSCGSCSGICSCACSCSCEGE